MTWSGDHVITGFLSSHSPGSESPATEFNFAKQPDCGSRVSFMPRGLKPATGLFCFGAWILCWKKRTADCADVARIGEDETGDG